MGTILQGTCAGCGYHAELFTGGGQSDCDPVNALRIARNDPGLAVALREKAWFRIDRKAAVCSRCHKLVTETSIAYQLRGRQGRVIKAGCPDCGGQLLALPSKDMKDIPCPVCGRSFALTPAGVWD